MDGGIMGTGFSVDALLVGGDFIVKLSGLWLPGNRAHVFAFFQDRFGFVRLICQLFCRPNQQFYIKWTRKFLIESAIEPLDFPVITWVLLS